MFGAMVHQSSKMQYSTANNGISTCHRRPRLLIRTLEKAEKSSRSAKTSTMTDRIFGDIMMTQYYFRCLRKPRLFIKH
jgi:hypothetical protein